MLTSILRSRFGTGSVQRKKKQISNTEVLFISFILNRLYCELQFVSDSMHAPNRGVSTMMVQDEYMYCYTPNRVLFLERIALLLVLWMYFVFDQSLFWWRMGSAAQRSWRKHICLLDTCIHFLRALAHRGSYIVWDQQVYTQTLWNYTQMLLLHTLLDFFICDGLKCIILIP